MELWVRSQDKLRLFKIKNVMISVIKSEQNKIICNYEEDFEGNEVSIPLGIYKTKERALEILDEIHQRLINLGTIEIAPDSYKVLPKDTSNVYEMPKE